MTAMISPSKQNAFNKSNKNGIRIKISGKETYGITQNKMLQPGTRRPQEKRKDLA